MRVSRSGRGRRARYAVPVLWRAVRAERAWAEPETEPRARRRRGPERGRAWNERRAGRGARRGSKRASRRRARGRERAERGARIRGAASVCARGGHRRTDHAPAVRAPALDDPARTLADDATGAAGARGELATAPLRLGDARGGGFGDERVGGVGAGDGFDGARADFDGVAHAGEDPSDDAEAAAVCVRRLKIRMG